MVERANQFDANVVRPALSTMNILMGHKLPSDMKIEEFWCCALQMGTMVHRRVYNRMRTIQEFVPCGSLITVVDPSKDKLPKLDQNRAIQAHFCAFGSNLRYIIYWDPQHPRQLKRSYHCVVEDTATFAQL